MAERQQGAGRNRTTGDGGGRGKTGQNGRPIMGRAEWGRGNEPRRSWCCRRQPIGQQERPRTWRSNRRRRGEERAGDGEERVSERARPTAERDCSAGCGILRETKVRRLFIRPPCIRRCEYLSSRTQFSHLAPQNVEKLQILSLNDCDTQT